MGAKLIVVSGKSAGKAIGLKQGKLLIGRADECDVRPLGEEVSRRHCLLEMVDESLTVKDLGSRNGTSVNGTMTSGRVVLADGDIVRVGPLELRVSCDRPAAAASRPPSDGDDVSRWLMADDEPAGISDTTRSLRVNADESLPVGADDEESSPSPVAAAAAASVANDASTGSSSAIEAVLASKSQPGALPAAAKNSKSDNSREAAAEALKKFFGKK